MRKRDVEIDYNNPLVNDIPKGQGYIITIGNSKGGVSKTTTTALLGFVCAKMGLKTLVIDTDKQANMTKTLFNTYANINPDEDYPLIKKTFMQGIKEKNLKDTIMPIMDNLDLVPGYSDTRGFAEHVYSNIQFKEDRDFLLNESLKRIRSQYDMILIDSPPNNYEIMRNVTLASDYVIVAFQPHEHSLTGAETYIDDLESLNKEYDLELFVLGFLPTLFSKKSRNDDYILGEAIEMFDDENIFNSIIYLMERVKGWDIDGITEHKDYWDPVTISKYKEVADEFVERLLRVEGIIEEVEEDKGGES